MITIPLEKDFYAFDDGKVREFLIIGDDYAYLIDTGFKGTPLKEAIAKLTTLPIKVILTHGDGDHIGTLSEFEECYFHQKDEALIQPTISFHYIKEGDTFNIGHYCFEVIEIPGHSNGSIALLEKKKHWLIVGDSVQDEGPIYMFGKHRDLDDYINSLKKLQSYQTDSLVIYPSHHRCPIDSEYIKYCLEDALKLKASLLKSKPHESMPCNEYVGEYTKFYYK